MPGDHVALKRALRAARAEAGYKSDKALALATGVHYQTLQNWMYGKTTPRGHELSKFARVLGKPQDYFMAMYENREPTSAELLDRMDALTAAVDRLVREIRAERASRNNGRN